jgi:hypothetical protein
MMMRLEQITCAEKRFPQNPNVVYFIDEENDMAYVDPNTNEIKKEFYDYTDWVDSYDIFGKDCSGHTASS